MSYTYLTSIEARLQMNIHENTIQSLHYSYDLGNKFYERTILTTITAIDLFSDFEKLAPTRIIGLGGSPDTENSLPSEIGVSHLLRLAPDTLIIPNLNQLIADASNVDDLLNVLEIAGDTGVNITIGIDDLDYISISFIMSLIGRSVRAYPTVQRSLLVFGEF